MNGRPGTPGSDPGFNLPSSQVRELQLLESLYELQQEVGDGQLFGFHELFESLEHDQKRALGNELRGLKDRGLLHIEETLVWDSWSGLLLPAGREAVETVRHIRSNRGPRRMHARDAVLQWLYDQNAHGVSSPVLKVSAMGSFGLYFGEPFTDEEIAAASTWLKELDYVSGSGSWGGGVLRPSITAKGERAVESGRSVNDQEAGGQGGVSVNVSGRGHSVAVAAHSPGAQQSIALGRDDRSQVHDVAQALMEMQPLLGLDDDGQARAQQVVAQLQQLADSPDSTTEDVKTALESMKAVVLSGVGTAGGKALLALGQQVAEGLGLA